MIFQKNPLKDLPKISWRTLQWRPLVGETNSYPLTKHEGLRDETNNRQTRRESKGRDLK